MVWTDSTNINFGIDYDSQNYGSLQMGFKTRNMDKQAKKIWHAHNIQHGCSIRPSTRTNIKKIHYVTLI